MGTWVLVPIPGAAEIAALFDNTNILKAFLSQSGSGQQPAEAAADDDDFDFVGDGVSFLAFHIPVIQVFFELTGDLNVLIVALFAQSLIAL